LTARYCLYTAHRDRIFRGEIDHAPWPLQHADVEINVNSMARAQGLTLPNDAPHLLFARDIAVDVWPLTSL
jgi:hypothetical protein